MNRPWQADILSKRTLRHHLRPINLLRSPSEVHDYFRIGGYSGVTVNLSGNAPPSVSQIAGRFGRE
jgi:hypothetical protein